MTNVICGGCHPGILVLDDVRKQAEQVMTSKSVSSTPPRSYYISSCLELVLGLLQMIDYELQIQTNPFFLKLLLAVVFYCNNRNLN